MSLPWPKAIILRKYPLLLRTYHLLAILVDINHSHRAWRELSWQVRVCISYLSSEAVLYILEELNALELSSRTMHADRTSRFDSVQEVSVRFVMLTSL